MNDNHADPLPVVRAADLEDANPERRWLIESLWTRAGVGFIGGAPKLGKSWLGLDLALSVASASPCLDTFHVHQPGPSLLYMAEDAATAVKARLVGLCHHRGLELKDLPIYVITAPTLRLDLDDDQGRLHQSVARLKPRLLLLDPFVRLHRGDENHSGDVAAILAYLRQLQRAFDLAIVIVHHTRKNTRPGAPGQNLRGSSDFYAWFDSCLHLHHHKDTLVLTPEHRTAPAPGPTRLHLHAPEDDHDTHLEVLDQPTTPHDASPDLEADILATLAQQPLTRPQLRTALRVRNQRLGSALDRLAQRGRIIRQLNRWGVPIPTPTEHPERNAANRSTQATLNLTPT